MQPKMICNMIACGMEGTGLGDTFQKHTPDGGKDANIHAHNLFFIEERALDKHQVQVVPGRIFSLGPYVSLSSIGGLLA